jgi:threonine dehydrogenase-like Zn-dependent dehydrogenase
MFALILCHAAGITPIITSSSDSKLAEIQKIWPGTKTINYKIATDQQAEVARLTDGKGVDVVVNNTGVGSLITDISSLRLRGGVVSLVGFLAGMKADWEPAALMTIMSKTAILK